ncbi:hypothetical protein AB1E18_007091 [Capra hircus]
MPFLGETINLVKEKYLIHEIKTVVLSGDGLAFGVCVFLPNHAVTVMLNRTEPYVPEGGAYLPEREPFIVPVEPERTADEYEDYGADEPAGEHPPHARWRRALPHHPRQ